MVSIVEESWQHRSFRLLTTNTIKVLPVTAHTLKVMPIPKARKWAIGGVVADGLRSATNSHKVVQMAEGFKMELDLSESYERRMYYSRLYAPVLASLFKYLLMPGDTVIDGGANIGYFSLLAATCIGEYGSVHSFEPVLQTFEALNKNVRLNTFINIHTNRLALTQSAGELCFEIPKDTYTGNPLGRLATTALLGRGPQVTVPAGTLDEYAGRSGITSVKLVKLDVEGSEVAAIAGMRLMLSEHRISYLICELSTILLDERGISYAAMQEALIEHGYSCFLIKSAGKWIGGEPVNLVATSLEEIRPMHGDYLFVAPGMTIPRDMTT
jgi:FkbM family methyltransferase